MMPVAARASMASSWVVPSSSPKASGPAGRSRARTRKLAIWPLVTSSSAQKVVAVHPSVMPVAARALMASSWVVPSSSPKASGPAGRSRARYQEAGHLSAAHSGLRAEEGPGVVASQGYALGRKPGDLFGEDRTVQILEREADDDRDSRPSFGPNGRSHRHPRRVDARFFEDVNDRAAVGGAPVAKRPSVPGELACWVALGISGQFHGEWGATVGGGGGRLDIHRAPVTVEGGIDRRPRIEASPGDSPPLQVWRRVHRSQNRAANHRWWRARVGRADQRRRRGDVWCRRRGAAQRAVARGGVVVERCRREDVGAGGAQVDGLGTPVGERSEQVARICCSHRDDGVARERRRDQWVHIGIGRLVSRSSDHEDSGLARRLYGLAERRIEIGAERGPPQRDVDHIRPVGHGIGEAGDDIVIGADLVAHPHRHEPDPGATPATPWPSMAAARIPLMIVPWYPWSSGRPSSSLKSQPWASSTNPLWSSSEPLPGTSPGLSQSRGSNSGCSRSVPVSRTADHDGRAALCHLPRRGCAYLCRDPTARPGAAPPGGGAPGWGRGDARCRRKVGLGAGIDPEQRPPQSEHPRHVPPVAAAAAIGLVEGDEVLAGHCLHLGGGAAEAVAEAVPGSSAAASSATIDPLIIPLWNSKRVIGQTACPSPPDVPRCADPVWVPVMHWFGLLGGLPGQGGSA